MADQNTITLTPQDRDMAVRTMLGEAANQGDDGLAAVGNVILNRASTGRYGGTSPTGVVLAKSQFEPWSSRAQELMDIPTDSPAYKKAGEIFDALVSGSRPDNTGGATHFYAPKAQAALGRNAPSWASGNGQQIGDHVFYSPEGRVVSQGPQNAVAAIDTAAPAASNPASGSPPAGALSYSGDDLLKMYSKPAAAPASPPPAAAPGPSGDDILKLYTKPGGAPAAAGSDQPKPGVVFATPGNSTPLQPVPPSTPDDLIKLYSKPDTKAPVTAPTAPAASPRTNSADSVLNSSASGFASGVPLIGPWANDWANKGTAGLLSLIEGKPYANELLRVQQQEKEDVAAHPTANTVGSVGGAVAGTIPAVLAAPEAFGISSAGLVGNALLGAGTGAAIGTADAASRSYHDTGAIDPTELKQGALVGAGGGFMGPLAGYAAGAGVRGATNLLMRTTPAARDLANTFQTIGLAPSEARNALLRMGPQATIADVDPALTAEVGGLASMGGRPTSILKKFFNDRAAGADNRASELIDRTLGPKPDFDLATAAFKENARRAASPFYEAAKANPTPMDISPILRDLDARIPIAAGDIRETLKKVRGYMVNDVPGLGTLPKSDPQQLLEARQAMDDLIERASKSPNDTTHGQNALSSAQKVRSKLDDVLKRDPNIARGDAAFSEQMQLRDAMRDGTELFTKGVRPEEFKRAFATMTSDQQEAYRAGARTAIADAMEQSRRGEMAAAQSMFARGSANRAKLDVAFPNAQEALDALHAETAMRGTERSVSGNSLTAERRAIQEKYRPSAPSVLDAAPAVVGEAVAGGQGAVAGMGLRAAYKAGSNALAQRALNRLTIGNAEGLSATGPAQNALLDAIERAHSSNALGVSLSNAGSAAANLLLPRTRSNPLLPQF